MTQKSYKVGVPIQLVGCYTTKGAHLFWFTLPFISLGGNPKSLKSLGFLILVSFLGLRTSQEGMFRQEEAATEQDLLGSSQGTAEARHSLLHSFPGPRQRMPPVRLIFFRVSYSLLRDGCVLDPITQGSLPEWTIP